jgi:hypothetical protein
MSPESVARTFYAFLLDEFTIGLCWHWAKALGGVRLQVSPEDVEDALAILEEDPLPAAEPILADQEQVTGQALRAAVFGTVSSPVELYAVWLFLPVLGWSGRLSATERRNIVAAVVLIGLTTVFPALLAFAPKQMR